MARRQRFKDDFRKAMIQNGYDPDSKENLRTLADALDVVPAYVIRMLKGHSLPHNDLILKICEALKLQVERTYLLVTREKTETPNLLAIFRRLIYKASRSKKPFSRSKLPPGFFLPRVQ